MEEKVTKFSSLLQQATSFYDYDLKILNIRQFFFPFNILVLFSDIFLVQKYMLIIRLSIES